MKLLLYLSATNFYDKTLPLETAAFSKRAIFKEAEACPIEG